MKYIFRIVYLNFSKICYLFYCLKYRAPAHPKSIIYISPDELLYSIEGTWYSTVRSFYLSNIIVKNYRVKKSLPSQVSDMKATIHDVFVRDMDAEKTTYFQKRIERNNSEKWLKKARKFRGNYAQIYERIQKDGFRVPESILSKIDYFPVAIDEEGNFMFMTGKHRLALATACNLNKIPVKVSLRHKKWQRYRDELFTKLKSGELSKNDIIKMNHPDLFDLID